MADESKVGRLKRLLLDELITQLTDGPTAVDGETGELVRLSVSDKVLNSALAAVKAFHSEAGEVTDQAAAVNGLLKKYQERAPGPRSDA